MELLNLQLFLSAMQSGNFSVTAEQYNMTQSSVSKRIHVLEDELGVSLFDRLGRRIIPNEAARLVAPYAEAILIQQQRMDMDIKRYLIQHQNVINLGMLGFSATYGFWNVLSSFQAEYSNIQVTVHALQNKAILDAIDNFICNFGLLYEVDSIREQYQTWHLSSDRLGVFYIQDIPAFRGRKSISIHELENRSLALHAEGTQIGDYAQELLTRHDVHPASIYTDFYLEPIYHLMSTQPILMMMPVGTLNPPRSIAKIHVRILEEAPEIFMSLVHSKASSLTSTEKIFVKHCKESTMLLTPPNITFE